MTDLNDFHMPFLMEAAEAARRTIDGLERSRTVIRYPRRLAWPVKIAASIVPEWVWRAAVGGGQPNGDPSAR